MLAVARTPRFKRDVKTCAHRHWDLEALKDTIARLARSDEEPIPDGLRPHALHGDLRGYRAVHVPSRANPPRDTWVVVYRIVEGRGVLLVRTGTHDEVFG